MPEGPHCTTDGIFRTTVNTRCMTAWQIRANAARTTYQACLDNKKRLETRCSTLKAVQARTGVSITKANGAQCKNSTDCASGYCMPGPAGQPARATVPSSGEQWYCTAAKANCAIPDKSGGMYRQTLVHDGQALICQNPGKGLWAQFLPR
jgi:hypothetical protein